MPWLPSCLLRFQDKREGFETQSGVCRWVAQDGAPSFGVCTLAENVTPGPDRFGSADGAAVFNGASSKLRYQLPYYPGGEWFCGKLDDFAFYAKALAPGEIDAAARETRP